MVISPWVCLAAIGLMQAYPDEHERAYFEKSCFAQIKVDGIISTKAFPNVELI